MSINLPNIDFFPKWLIHMYISKVSKEDPGENLGKKQIYFEDFATLNYCNMFFFYTKLLIFGKIQLATKMRNIH